jgi:hypothetical protein
MGMAYLDIIKSWIDSKKVIGQKEKNLSPI